MVANELAGELKSLRKGRGVLADRIGDRTGPQLRRLCGVDPADSSAAIREKLAGTLRSLIEGLPPDLRGPMIAAYALDDEVRHPLYQDRVAHSAKQQNRDQRTIRRRIDAGVARIVEIAERRAIPETGDDPGPGWYTAEVRTLVNLALPQPEAFEFRRVVAEHDGLSAIALAFTVTAPPGGEHPAPVIDVFSGGTLVATRRQSSDRIGFEVKLPKPLARGAAHECVLRFRMRAGVPMKPHYVCVPKGRCDLFRLQVRFDPRRPPGAVWRLNGAFQRDLDDPLADGEPGGLDETCEVDAEFRRLAPGLAYGFRWQDAPSS